MKNLIIEREGDILTLKVDLSRDYGPSRTSGKTIIVASSGGNINIPGLEDYGFKLGLFVYFYPGALKKYKSNVPKRVKVKRVSRRPLNGFQKKRKTNNSKS